MFSSAGSVPGLGIGIIVANCKLSGNSPVSQMLLDIVNRVSSEWYGRFLRI